jgi:hypothetical protein
VAGYTDGEWAGAKKRARGLKYQLEKTTDPAERKQLFERLATARKNLTEPANRGVREAIEALEIIGEISTLIPHG